MVQINSSNFDKYINRDTLTLVDFYATWCGPCMLQSKVLDKIDNSRSAGVEIVKVDIDEVQDVATRYNIESIPTLLLVRNGEVLAKHIGYIDEKNLIDMIERYIKE